MDSATLKLEELPHFRPASEAASVVPDADVVLITGTTLLNNTLEKLLALCQPKARVVLVGPTVGLLPDAFLRRGVDVLGGVRVTAPDSFLDVLMEGGSAYHYFGRSAEKLPSTNCRSTSRRQQRSSSPCREQCSLRPLTIPIVMFPASIFSLFDQRADRLWHGRIGTRELRMCRRQPLLLEERGAFKAEQE